MFCRNCGNSLDANASVCTKCGVLRGKGVKHCWNCAKSPDPNAAICLSCGADLGNSARRAGTPLGGAAGGKSKVTAGILGILLGGLGVHRFYLGYTTIGIVQVVLTICTFGFAGIWGLVEGICILCGQLNIDAAGLPLTE